MSALDLSMSDFLQVTLKSRSGVFQEVDNPQVELMVVAHPTAIDRYRVVARSNGQEVECAEFSVSKNELADSTKTPHFTVVLLTYFYTESQAQAVAFLRARGLQANVVMAFLGHFAKSNNMLIAIGEDQWKGTTLVDNDPHYGGKVVVDSKALQSAARGIIEWSYEYTPPARRPPPSEDHAKMAKYSDLEFQHFPLNFPFENENPTAKAAAVWLMTAMVRIPRYKRMEFLERIKRLGFYGQFFDGDTLVTEHIDTQFIRMPAIITYPDEVLTTSSIRYYQEESPDTFNPSLPNALDESLLNMSGLSLNSSGYNDFTTL